MKRTEIVKALTRPILLLGCERIPLILLGTLCSMLVVTLNLFLTVIALIIFMGGVWGLRKMAKKDPMMTSLYFRHIKFEKIYNARPSIYRFL